MSVWWDLRELEQIYLSEVFFKFYRKHWFLQVSFMKNL